MCPVSDYYQLDELLTTEEKDVRARVREFAEKHIAPIIAKVIEIPQLFVLAMTNYSDSCAFVLSVLGEGRVPI